MRHLLDFSIKRIILSMPGEFTIEELIAKLAAENVMVEDNKQEVLEMVDAYLEGPFINHIPFTDKYFVE